MSDAQFDRSRLDGLIDILLQVPELSERVARDAVVNDLHTALGRPFEPSRADDVRTDLASITETCAAYSGGPRTLARLVRRRYPGDKAGHAAEVADDVAGPDLLSSQDRVDLREIMSRISIMEIAGAVPALGDVPHLQSIGVWADLSTAIRAMERLPRPPGGLPPLLAFITRLAEIEADRPDANRLRDWLATVTPALVGDMADQPSRARAAHYPSSLVVDQLRSRRPNQPGLIWGNVPGRNPHFTGRAALLNGLVDELRKGNTTSVLPHALQGLGGVGKTQLVVEYVYLHLDEYDLVWWIPAEQTATVLTSLGQLAERLGLAADEESQEVARTVLTHLAETDLEWLLVYDNADDPHELRPLMPSTGGHVIVTTRNQAWSSEGRALEVDVFERHESVSLLMKRTREERTEGITRPEAEELAERLGDLPLALEQAAAWYLATRMPVREYIDLLDDHIKDLLNEGKPASYPLSIPAFVAVALTELRNITIRDMPDSTGVAAQLFALFAYLGGEPISLSLFRAGSRADISEPLRTVLSASIPTNRAVRLLSQYGLAKVDAQQRVQVHRLVQAVLRDTLTDEQKAQTLRDVRNLLGAASPGDPDEEGVTERHAQIGPHIEPADMIHGELHAVRQAVLDHSRYLFIVGDYENCRYLARLAADAWEVSLGPESEQTLQAWAQWANASRTLGDSKSAAEVMRRTYERQQRSLGAMHELTLINGNQVGVDLRIAGRYNEALAFDAENVARHIEVFQRGHTYTLRAQANLAVDHRMIGQFADALELERQIAEHWENVGAVDLRALKVYVNVARSYYGMGAYRVGMTWLERWRPELVARSGPTYAHSLLASRTYAVTLRKLGEPRRALEAMKETYERTLSRFKIHHEFTVAAAVSYANALRETGDLDQALTFVQTAVQRYETDFGHLHPLTLVARVNAGIIHRARGDHATARRLDESCFPALSRALSPRHPYTLCAGTSLATDLAEAGEHREALELSQRLVALDAEADRGDLAELGGVEHPYRLMRAVNLSHDLRTNGEAEAADELFTRSLAGLRTALRDPDMPNRPDHPDVVDAERGKRFECDIEPPPS